MYQLHKASGISDREIFLVLAHEDIAGGKRFTWTKAPVQEGMKGNVEIEVDTGKWEVTAAPGGGSKVVYELRYAAGGSVPSFMVRWFQGAGIQALLGELRAYAERG